MGPVAVAILKVPFLEVGAIADPPDEFEVLRVDTGVQDVDVDVGPIVIVLM